MYKFATEVSAFVKFLPTIFAVLLPVSPLYASANSAGYSIIPNPARIDVCDTPLSMTKTIVVADNKGLDSIKTYLKERLGAITGGEVRVLSSVPDGAGTTIFLDLDASLGTSPDAYSFDSGSGAIHITGSAPSGVFYGVQTLLQLLPTEIWGRQPFNGEISVPCARIVDAPRFEWRGLMLDLSRHFFGKERLKKIIDQMAMHKLNRFHLHLTDDPGWRIEIQKYPRLTAVGALGNKSDPTARAQYLSQDDIKEIIEYGASRFITIIPEVDMPGHAGAMARAYPEHSDGKVTFNIGNRETIQFIKDILEEVMTLFPGPYVHFGADELRNHDLESLPEVQALMKKKGLTSIEEVEADFDRTIADFLIARGKTPVAWDEVSSFELDTRTIVQWWRFWRPEALEAAISAGHRVIMSPGNHVYFDYAQAPGEPGAPWEGNDNGPNSLELIYNWEPIPETFSSAASAQVIGVEAAVWTEFIKSEHYLEFMMYPRLAALSEVAWSERGRKDLSKFRKRLDAQMERYDAMGINFRKPGRDGDPAAQNVAPYLTN